jgi:hypothetical protein
MEEKNRTHGQILCVCFTCITCKPSELSEMDEFEKIVVTHGQFYMELIHNILHSTHNTFIISFENNSLTDFISKKTLHAHCFRKQCMVTIILFLVTE